MSNGVGGMDKTLVMLAFKTDIGQSKVPLSFKQRGHHENTITVFLLLKQAKFLRSNLMTILKKIRKNKHLHSYAFFEFIMHVIQMGPERKSAFWMPVCRRDRQPAYAFGAANKQSII